MGKILHFYAVLFQKIVVLKKRTNLFYKNRYGTDFKAITYYPLPINLSCKVSPQAINTFIVSSFTKTEPQRVWHTKVSSWYSRYIDLVQNINR